jgi:hypothetical protein
MRKRLHIRAFLALVLISILSLFFLNASPSRPAYEVEYVNGSGIPLSEIVEATIQDVERFKDPNIQIKPRIIVEIKPDEVVYLDKSVDIDELVINGQLHCDSQLAQKIIEIKAEVIYVNGLFQCGEESRPYSKKLTISLKSRSGNPRLQDAHRALIVNNGGRMILTGNRQNAGWYRLDQSAKVGDTFIRFPKKYIFPGIKIFNLKSPWKVGDEIVIGPSSFDPSEAETFKITRIEGDKIFLNDTIKKFHLGKKEFYNTTYNGRVEFNPSAEVANISRNILIRPDESISPISTTSEANAEIGGHVMVMRGGQAYVDSVEFYHMGQAGIMARYPFHWHFVGDAPGQFIKNSSVHHSFQRCITVHRTNKTLVHNNVCYDFKGHGYFYEDGVEIDNTLSNNLGILSRFPHASKVLLASDHPTVGNESSGRFPNVSTYWISNPQNTILNNVASGYVGSGFWMSFEGHIHNSSGQVIATPIWTNTKKFEGNSAHSGKVGFTWDGAPVGALTNNPNNPKDRKIEIAAYNPGVTPVFSRLTAFKNKLTGFYFRGTTALFEGGVSADNGRHYWMAFNQIIRNAVIIGKSTNFSEAEQLQALVENLPDRSKQVGVVQYDGPFELDGVDFLNYPTQKTFYNSIETTPLPISVIFSFERLHNSSKRVAFNPDPIHRAYMAVSPNDPDYRDELSKASGMRDLDGSLSGAPGMIVASKSLGIAPTSGCISLGEKFQGFSRCPANYSESYLHIFGGEGHNLGLTSPFVVRRSDGALSFAMSEWNTAFGWPYRAGHIVSLNNSGQYDYEILMNGVAKPEFHIISEPTQTNTSVIKLVGQGQNCVLKNKQNLETLPLANSLSSLRSATTSSYFAEKNDIYFKLIPKDRHWTIRENNGNQGSAMRLSSIGVQVSCSGTKAPYVLGYLDSVTKNKTDGSVKMKGWACNQTVLNQVQVNLSVFSSNFKQAPTITSLAKVTSNLASEAAVNFACANPTNTGYRFEAIIPPSVANLHSGKKVIAVGISNNGGSNKSLFNSGSFTMP